MSTDFFLSRLGTWVLRTDKCDDKPRKYLLIKPENPAKEFDYVRYYHSLQAIGTKFAPIVNIHRNLQECESCSA